MSKRAALAWHEQHGAKPLRQQRQRIWELLPRLEDIKAIDLQKQLLAREPQRRQQVVVGLAGQQQHGPSQGQAQHQAAEQQVAVAALAVAAPPLPPMPLPPAPAAQHVVEQPRQPLPLPGRKCAWCGVTETSNWRRHPEDRDMLLCNQVRAACGSRMEGDSAGGAEAVRGELTSRLPMGCSSASWSVQLRCCV